MTRSRAFAGLASTVLLLLAGCSDDGGNEAELPASVTTVAVTTTSPGLTSAPVGIELPRSFQHRGIEFVVTQVEMSNATPGSYLDDEPLPHGGELLYVRFSAAYVDDDGPGEQWAVGQFVLVTGDGTAYGASGVDYESVIVVAPGETTTSALAFPALDDMLDGAILRIDDGTQPPPQIPLFDEPAPPAETAPPPVDGDPEPDDG